MTDLSALTLESLKTLEAEVSALRDTYIRAELGKAVTPFNRANSKTPLDGRVYEIVSEIMRRKQPAKDTFATAWTAEVFATRRAAWNAESVKLPRSAKGIKFEDLRALEARLGYTMDDLKRAKAMLGVA